MNATADRDTAFDPRRTATRLLREARSAALATLAAGSGHPYCSLANVATAADGAPLLLLSQLALHTRNIAADRRASVLFSEAGAAGDRLQHGRVTVTGSLSDTKDPAARRRYLARHPDAEAFANFTDFAFYRLEVEGAHLVAGFGRIVDLSAAQLLTSVADAESLLTAEADACAHMNADHADAVRLYATRLRGAADGDWRCVGCDPEGLDLQCAGVGLRLPFPQRVRTPAELRGVLVQLAEAARRA